jgi:hypothetical protein
MAASLRRWGLTGLAAVLGGVLFVGGIAVAVGDALLRSDAATRAVTLTTDEREAFDEVRILDAVLAEAGSVRRSLIVQNLFSGAPMPERAFEISELQDGTQSMSWGIRQDGFRVMAWGGWQLKPVGIMGFAGLALLIASGFAFAARWEKQHPLARN